MDVRRLLKLDVEITHITDTGPPDEMGDPGEEITTSSFKGWYWQTRRDEDTANIAVSREEHRLALEPAAFGQVHAGDRAAVDGLTFEVDGPPWNARNPRTGILEFVEATIVRTPT